MRKIALCVLTASLASCMVVALNIMRAEQEEAPRRPVFIDKCELKILTAQNLAEETARINDDMERRSRP